MPTGGNVGGTSSLNVKAALIDLNGTLHIGSQPTPGAVAALEKLRSSGVAVRFVTNTTKDTVDNLLLSLVHGLGFQIDTAEVFSSLTATSRLLRQHKLRPFLLLHPDALPDFSGVPTDDPNCVVVGLAKEAFSYENMNKAFRILLKPGSRLVAIHRARLFKEGDGQLSLGPGAYVAGLEYSSGKEAQVVGKPEAAFFQLALTHLGCAASETVMIGDDIQSDIGGAQAVGCQGFLVRTGKYRAGDEEAEGIEPTAVCDNFAAAVEWILERNAAAPAPNEF